MYLGTAVAESGNSAGFAHGEKHTVLVFLSDYSQSYDWNRAEAVASDHGWREIEFSKVGRVTAEMIAAQDPTMRERYQSSIAEGSAFIAYAEVL